jgi:hypothetical protein
LHISGFTYECYVPDTQILFPHVFLGNIDRLPRNDALYKECIDCILQNKIRLAILPSNHYEFRNLILKKFEQFLIDIGKTALKQKGKDAKAFFSSVTNLIRARIASNQYPSDFLIYWSANTNYFSQWLTLDERAMYKRQWDLMFELLEKFTDIIDHAEINIKKWDKPDLENEANDICKTLKKLRGQKAIPPDAHEQDLEIIADCVVYRNNLLPTGVIYLITNDGICLKTVKALICFKDEKGNTIYAPGLDCITPEILLSKVKAILSEKK